MGIVRHDLTIIHPLEGGFSVTPDDNTDFPKKTRAIYVGTTGDLAVVMANGNTITFTDIAAGVFHPLQVIRVLSTGTTATGIIGMV